MSRHKIQKYKFPNSIYPESDTIKQLESHPHHLLYHTEFLGPMFV